jgi:hypothetical protein
MRRQTQMPRHTGRGTEFGAIGSYGADHPGLLMYVDHNQVRLTALFADALDQWATYIREDPSWDVHAASTFPVSSMHRSAYSNVEAHPITAATLPRYDEMLTEMAARGPMVTVRLPRYR